MVKALEKVFGETEVTWLIAAQLRRRIWAACHLRTVEQGRREFGDVVLHLVRGY
jgi:hypothetical protein